MNYLLMLLFFFFFLFSLPDFAPGNCGRAIARVHTFPHFLFPPRAFSRLLVHLKAWGFSYQTPFPPRIRFFFLFSSMKTVFSHGQWFAVYYVSFLLSFSSFRVLCRYLVSVFLLRDVSLPFFNLPDCFPPSFSSVYFAHICTRSIMRTSD